MPGSFTLFENTEFGGRALTFHLDAHAENALHSIKGTDLHDRVSSLTWDLPADTLVILFEHDDGTGRAYPFGPGTGADASTHDKDFKDCATTWRWTTLSSMHSVKEAFGWIGTVGQVSKFRRGATTLEGGHLQGVGLVDIRTLAISTSGHDEARVLFVAWDERIGSGTGSIVGELVVGTIPLDHGGGLQIADGVLAVGTEDNDDKDRSRVVFHDVTEAPASTELAHLAFDRPGPGQAAEHKRWTAGAVGMGLVGNSYLLVVGSWGSDELDFYRSTGPDLRDPTCRFRHVADWSEDDADTGTWIDDNWASYESLNLIIGTDDRVFLIGGNRSNGRDWIDLYEVDLDAPRSIRLTKLAKRHLTCRDGASFRWSGGIATDGTVLHAVTTERDLHNRTTVNVFNGPGGLSGGASKFRFLANTRTRETHSLIDPCPWVVKISLANRLPTDGRPAGFGWCDFCFPERADG